MRIFVVFLLIGSVVFEPLLAKVYVEASPTSLPLNHILHLTVTLENQQGSIGFEVENLQQLQGRQNYKTSIEIVNMKVSKRTVYSYAFRPIKEGSASLRVLVDGKEEGNVAVKVLPASPSPQASPSSPSALPGRPPKPNNPFGFGSKNRRSIGPEDIVITNTISKPNAVVGEVFVLTTTMYYKPGIESPRLLEPDRLVGFTIDEVPKSEVVRELPRRTLNGQIYEAYVLKKQVLYAHYAGLHELKGGTYSVGQSSFFFRFSDRVKVQANDLSIRIREVPRAGKPKTFQNAVGDFSITANQLPDEVANQEAFLWRITLSGQGNFKTLVLPKPAISSPSVILKQSQIRDDFRITASNYEGKKVVEYYLLPQEAKPIQIPELAFGYYSPDLGGYITKKLPGKTVRVALRNGEQPQAQQPQKTSENNSFARHLFPIDRSPLGEAQQQSLLGSRSFVFTHMAVAFLVLLFPSWRLGKALRLSPSRNEFLKPFRRQLLALKSLTGSPFLNEIQDLLFRYLREKYGLQKAVSTYQMTKSLKDMQAPGEVFELLERINGYQRSLFSPVQTSFNPNDEVHRCLGLMERIERRSSGVSIRNVD